MKRLLCGVLALTMLTPISALAGWKPGEGEHTGRWWYEKEDGTWYAGTGDTPLWQWIDGDGDGVAECYGFDQDGWAFLDTTTTDGYQVNADGAWTVNGEIQRKSVEAAAEATGEAAGEQKTEFVKAEYVRLLGTDISEVAGQYGAGTDIYSGYSGAEAIRYGDIQVHYMTGSGVVFKVLGPAAQLCDLGGKEKISVDELNAILGEELPYMSSYKHVWRDFGIPDVILTYEFGDIGIELTAAKIDALEGR